MPMGKFEFIVNWNIFFRIRLKFSFLLEDISFKNTFSYQITIKNSFRSHLFIIIIVISTRYQTNRMD